MFLKHDGTRKNKNAIFFSIDHMQFFFTGCHTDHLSSINTMQARARVAHIGFFRILLTHTNLAAGVGAHDPQRTHSVGSDHSSQSRFLQPPHCEQRRQIFFFVLLLPTLATNAGRRASTFPWHPYSVDLCWARRCTHTTLPDLRDGRVGKGQFARVNKVDHDGKHLSTAVTNHTTRTPLTGTVQLPISTSKWSELHKK